VHGPALPTDDPDQIYNDFAGQVGRNRPLPESFNGSNPSDSDDYGNYFDRRDPPSDGTVHWDQPESDGVLNTYDGQLAEEQRRKSTL
jgi:hypothetical protein